MSLIGRTVSYWETATIARPAIIIDDTGTDPLLHTFRFGSGDDEIYAPRATEPTEGHWTEPDES